MRYKDRQDAGIRLGNALLANKVLSQLDRTSLLVLSIPRGGVIVGEEIASILECDHDIVIIKKIGFPGHEELAMGAIAEDGTVLLNQGMVTSYRLTQDEVDKAIASAREKVTQYVSILRQEKTLTINDKVVILVDDGIATGETLKAAIHWLNEGAHHAKKIIVAVPVCSPDTRQEIQERVDQIICLQTPFDFRAVGQYYYNFEPVSDQEVRTILNKS